MFPLVFIFIVAAGIWPPESFNIEPNLTIFCLAPLALRVIPQTSWNFTPGSDKASCESTSSLFFPVFQHWGAAWRHLEDLVFINRRTSICLCMCRPSVPVTCRISRFHVQARSCEAYLFKIISWNLQTQQCLAALGISPWTRTGFIFFTCKSCNMVSTLVPALVPSKGKWCPGELHVTSKSPLNINNIRRCKYGILGISAGLFCKGQIKYGLKI